VRYKNKFVNNHTGGSRLSSRREEGAPDRLHMQMCWSAMLTARTFALKGEGIWSEPLPHFPYGVMLINLLIAVVQRDILPSNANHILAGQ
jgi:hypothetical protein